MEGSFLAGRGAPHTDLINELLMGKTGSLLMDTAIMAGVVGSVFSGVFRGTLGVVWGVN